MWRNCLKGYLEEQEQIIEMYWKDLCCNISTKESHINGFTIASAYVSVKPELPSQQVREIREVIL